MKNRGDEDAIRIGFVELYEGFAGGQQSLVELVRKLDRTRFEPIVFIAGGADRLARELKNTKCPIVRLGPGRGERRSSTRGIQEDPLQLTRSAFWALARMWEFLSAVRAREIDVLYANSLEAGVVAGIVGRLLRKPIILRARSGLDYSSHGWLDGAICRLATVIFANSEYVAKTFEEVKDAGAKTTVIYNSIEPSQFAAVLSSNEKESLEKELGVSGDEYLVGVIGRLTPRKRQMDIVKLASVLAEADSVDVRFLLLGSEEGPDGALYGASVREEIEARNLQSRVLLCGFRSDIPKIMQLLDGVILPSESEPLARVLIEAMAAGVPVVASDSGGNTELITHEKTGLLYPLGDIRGLERQVVRLCTDMDLRESLSGAAGRFLKDRFADERTVRLEERWFMSLHDEPL